VTTMAGPPSHPPEDEAKKIADADWLVSDNKPKAKPRAAPIPPSRPTAAASISRVPGSSSAIRTCTWELGVSADSTVYVRGPMVEQDHAVLRVGQGPVDEMHNGLEVEAHWDLVSGLCLLLRGCDRLA